MIKKENEKKVELLTNQLKSQEEESDKKLEIVYIYKGKESNK